jgi:hypothetical protein
MKLGDPCTFNELNIGDMFRREYYSPTWIKTGVNSCCHVDDYLARTSSHYSIRTNNSIKYFYAGVHFLTVVKHVAEKEQAKQ